jgi:type I restriction enzyme M protein
MTNEGGARTKRASKRNGTNGKNGGDLGFEATLWQAADTLRGNLDSGDYKHVVLGLVFLKYISDAFEERRLALADEPGADPEDRDEYIAVNVFWVPTEARWDALQAKAKQHDIIGKALDDAMTAIERDNPRLRGVLPKIYGREALDKERLGRLIDLIGTVGLGDKENRSKDILGRVYEYFLGQFASAEGKKGGEFFTPRHVVRLLVSMLAPHEDSRIFDPCCGSGGMFIQSEWFIDTHGGRRGHVAIYGEELNDNTRKMCMMNLAIRGIEGHIEQGDSFHADKFKDLKSDYVLANPPFNSSDWGGANLREDVRWKYGVPPVGNANFAWIQHFVHHLAPTGTAGFVMANGSMSSNTSGEGDIRKRIVDADLVDCVVALPPQLFYSTPIPVCLWFLARDKRNAAFRDRRRGTLFIDARKLGFMADRTHRELSDGDIRLVSDTYHAWRGDSDASGEYANVPGFCMVATTDDIAEHGYVLTPGRYVGAEDAEDDDEPFDEKMQRLLTRLEEQFAASAALETDIMHKVRGIIS